MGHFRILIIGQGLAGTVLSHALSTRNIPHKVLDNGHRSAATLAAAGIINPVTGRRYVKSWMIDDLLPAALRVYGELETKLGVKLITECDIVRTFEDLAQEKRWHEATTRPGYEQYVSGIPKLHGYEDLIQQPFSYGVIHKAKQVNVSELIIHYRKYLQQQGLLIMGEWSSDAVGYSDNPYKVGEDTFESIIFCTGYKSASDPLFSFLPFQPAKGESLQVEVAVSLPKALLRDKIFVAPDSQHTFWTGGGYEWDTVSEEPTDSFRREWEAKLDELLTIGYNILSHRAGVRPSVKGRRPLLGRHPDFASIFLFNGLGTKGTSLAPYWSEKMVDFMIKAQPLPEEVDLNRF